MKKVADKRALFVLRGRFLRSHRQYVGLIYPRPSHQHDASAYQDGVSDKPEQEISPWGSR